MASDDKAMHRSSKEVDYWQKELNPIVRLRQVKKKGYQSSQGQNCIVYFLSFLTNGLHTTSRAEEFLVILDHERSCIVCH